jgi:hypothetical protein
MRTSSKGQLPESSVQHVEFLHRIDLAKCEIKGEKRETGHDKHDHIFPNLQKRINKMGMILHRIAPRRPSVHKRYEVSVGVKVAFCCFDEQKIGQANGGEEGALLVVQELESF